MLIYFKIVFKHVGMLVYVWGFVDRVFKHICTRRPEEGIESLELELQEAVSYLIWNYT